jgi:hypothetical protein
VIAMRFWVFSLCAWCYTTCQAGESFATVDPSEQILQVPDVTNADVSMLIRSTVAAPLYKLQCHSVGYTGDPDFDYSGDFECRLSSVGGHDTYSTLLTEDSRQSRDWESRGRFFSHSLQGPCAHVPQFGATRTFKLRGIKLTLQVIDPRFSVTEKLQSLKLRVVVQPDPSARRSIAEVVPFPSETVLRECQLEKYFVKSSATGSQ